MLTRGDDADPAAERRAAADDRRADEDRDEGDDGDTTTTEEPVETVTAGPETTPTPSAAPAPEASCWNGTRAATLRACPYPTGAAGLRHVFDEFDWEGENCSFYAKRLASTRRVQFNCPSDGTDRVHFNFSVFDTHADGVDYYTGNAGAAPEPTSRPDVIGWSFYNGREYKGAVLYADATWGATIYADDYNLLLDTMDNLVRRMRPQSELRGTAG